MKRFQRIFALMLALVLLPALLLISSCDSQSSHPTLQPTDIDATRIQVGASFQELNTLLQGKDVLYLTHYAFFLDRSGDPVLIEYSQDVRDVVSVKVFPKSVLEASDNDFALIEIGMTVEEVVECVGLPIGSYTFGLCTLSFLSTEGTVYSITWDSDMKVLECNPQTVES